MAAEGKIFTTRQDQNILSQIPLNDCINPASLVLSTSESMDNVMQKFRNSDQNRIPVIDTNSQFLGILNREHLRSYLLGKKLTSEISVSALTIKPSFIINPPDSVMEVTEMFDEADVWQLPLLY